MVIFNFFKKEFLEKQVKQEKNYQEMKIKAKELIKQRVGCYPKI